MIRHKVLLLHPLLIARCAFIISDKIYWSLGLLIILIGLYSAVFILSTLLYYQLLQIQPQDCLLRLILLILY